ncbi:NAD-dependent epimerase/dehydratase family protein, partial [uncultured Corynebacterium sp.]|uniref:NAD-dependent epimerase/dehydratase family protein n=1 Tax=uncultured Corynebacterium sp. TaxID=159447 RepID=UPI0025E97A2F
MRTVVTGGAGFIGSHLVDLLIAHGHEVVVIDNLSRGQLSNLSNARETGKLTFVEADLLDIDFNEFLGEHTPEVIFHLAAQIDVRASVTDPLHDAETNILATIRIADAARQHGVRKVVFTSSGGSIYGEPDSFPVSEEAPVDPHSPY